MASDKKQSILGLIPLFEVMSSLKIAPELVLKNHALDLNSLSGSSLISQELEFAIIKDALSLTDDPLLGLKVGSQSTFTSYGNFALLVMSAGTFLEACEASVQFQALSLLFTHLSLHFEKDYFELRYRLPDTSPEILPFIADRDFAGTFNFMQELMGEAEINSIQCGIARPRPSDELLEAYRNISSINLQFDQSYSWLRLPNHYLYTRLKHGNALAHKLYRVQAQEVLRKIYPDEEDLVTQVRKILEGFECKYPSANELARMFGVSERTLSRKLDLQNSSFRLLLDEHRKQKALRMLNSGDHSISQLAERLGYTESASFLRAFKRWTGTTPKIYLTTK